MSAGIVVSLCDWTGNIVEPWAEAGYECYCFDIKHPIRLYEEKLVGELGGSIQYRWGDVRSLDISEIPGCGPTIVFAAPPCTHLAVSGARDFAKKGLRLLIDALELVEACRQACEWLGAPWMIENPVGRLSTCWRKPDHMFDPCDYGDPWTKKTCLLTGNDFVMPPKARVEPVEGSKMHLMAPSPDRAALRSETPRGFAEAVYQANCPRLRAKRGAA